MAASDALFLDRMDPVLDLLNQRPREDYQWKFEPDAHEHSSVNAVALCNMALLAYSDQAGARHFLEKWQFSDMHFLRGFHTQGIVARKDNFVVITFRGTEPINADDWLSDVNYHQRALSPRVAGLVHGGFARAFEEVLQPMLAAVGDLSRGSQPRLYLTGHSLGGALAVLAAAVLGFETSRDVAAVYTYGQPRVGDPDFSAAFDQKFKPVTFLYVNDFDLVPHVPPVRLPNRTAVPLGLPVNFLHQLAKTIKGESFSHVGQLKLFLRDGTLTSDDRRWQEREVIFSGTLTDLLSGFPGLLRARLGLLLHEQDRILDHDPLHGYLPKLEARVA
jgi:triacylglycerol lipase